MCSNTWNMPRFFVSITILFLNWFIHKWTYFFQAKSSSFKRNQPSGKFQDWLLKDSPTPETARSMTVKSWSILSYFAYETVAQIVDLAFIVRRDYNAWQVSDAVERNAVPRISPANADLSKVKM